jgi:hypothetical protein
MLLTDANTYGLILWGTKRGMMLFFDDNIDRQDSPPDQFMSDPGALFNFSRTGLTFYGIEHRETYSAFVIYRTILDSAGRPGGFYVFMLTVPTDRVFVHNTVQSLLNTLSDLYWKRYIATAMRPGQIDENTAEDFTVFSEIIRRPEYALTSAEDIVRPTGTDQCVITFTRPEDLDTLFQHFRRPELLAYQRVYLLPAGEPGIRHNLKIKELPPPAEKYNITLDILDAKQNRPPGEIHVAFYKNGIAVEPGRRVTSGEFALKGGVTRSDKIQLAISGDGYLQEDINEEYIFKNYTETAAYSGRVIIHLTPKAAPPPKALPPQPIIADPVDPAKDRWQVEAWRNREESNKEWERTHPNQDKKNLLQFISRNRNYLAAGFVFFSIIAFGTWYFADHSNLGHGGSGKMDTPNPKPHPVNPVASAYNFSADSLTLMSTLEEYRDNYDSAKEDDNYHTARDVFTRIEDSIYAQKKSPQYRRYTKFFDKQSEDFDKIRNQRTSDAAIVVIPTPRPNPPPTPTPLHKTQQEIDEELVTVLQRGIDAKDLTTKKKILRENFSAKTSKNTAVKTKFDALDQEINKMIKEQGPKTQN